MKRRLILLLTITTVLVAIGATIGASKDTSRNTASAPDGSRVNTVQRQTAGIIDGSVNPELVPDQEAYSLVFRLLSNRRTREDQNIARSYLRMAFQCGACNDASDEAHINAFLAVVKEFEQRVGVLDRRAKEIWQPRPSQGDMAELNRLQERKEAIVAELVASLPSRLGANGIEKFRRHIGERVKPRVKIYPEHAH